MAGDFPKVAVEVEFYLNEYPTLYFTAVPTFKVVELTPGVIIKIFPVTADVALPGCVPHISMKVSAVTPAPQPFANVDGVAVLIFALLIPQYCVRTAVAAVLSLQVAEA